MACKGQYFATAVNNYFNLHITLLFTILWTFAAHNRRRPPENLPQSPFCWYNGVHCTT